MSESGTTEIGRIKCHRGNWGYRRGRIAFPASAEGVVRENQSGMRKQYTRDMYWESTTDGCTIARG